MRWLLVIPLLSMATAGSLAGQGWRGDGRVSGQVTTLGGDPLVGAAVTLVQDEHPEKGPPVMDTAADGGWSFTGLAAGRWRITVEADGFETASGWVDVLSGRATPSLPVALRSLEEVPPRATEGNPQTVLAWIERGNTLLGQGQPAEARKEYLRALPHLETSSQVEVLRTVAQTYYLEKDVESAAEALLEALGLAPQDPMTRNLLSTLFEGVGRGDEAAVLLSRLDAGDLSVIPHRHLVEPEETVGPGLELLPLVAATPGREGRFRTRFGEKSPWNVPGELEKRLGLSGEDVGESYPLEGESWELYVPQEGDGPYGVFVWVSPDFFGGFTRDPIRNLLEEQRLIWVGANQSGNERWTPHRYGLALDAAHNVAALYPVDPHRIYVGGYSGGGRVASGLALEFPEVFKGGFFFFGCDFFRQIPVPYRPGTHWPARFPPPSGDELKALKEDHRFVFMTGTRDFNRAQTLAVFEHYVKDGFRHVTLLEIPDADHYHGFDTEWAQKGFDALDAPLHR